MEINQPALLFHRKTNVREKCTDTLFHDSLDNCRIRIFFNLALFDGHRYVERAILLKVMRRNNAVKRQIVAAEAGRRPIKYKSIRYIVVICT